MKLIYKNEDGSAIVMHDTETGAYEILKLVSHECEVKIEPRVMPIITKTATPQGFGRGKGPKTCAICKEQGHIAKTCPKRHGVYRKNVTGEDIERIQALKSEGKKSHEVAEILRIHLEAVNRHWVD